MEPSKECGDLVGLNVGGVLYQTSRTTLLRYPCSFFSGMLEGHVPSAKDGNGNFIIDHDGLVFRHILNFMRVGKIVLPNDFQEWHLFECEADFFGLEELQKEIQEITSSQVVPMYFNDGEMPSNGRLFRSTKQILSREGNSLFAKVVRGKVSKDSQGNLVIFRDGSMFPQVHSFLERGGVFIDLDKPSLETLRKDAIYYSLEVLKHQIDSIVHLRDQIELCKKHHVIPDLTLHIYIRSDRPCVLYANSSMGGRMEEWNVGDICKESVEISGGIFAGVLDPEKVSLGHAHIVDDVINFIKSKTVNDVVDFNINTHQIKKDCTKVLFDEFEFGHPVDP